MQTPPANEPAPAPSAPIDLSASVKAVTDVTLSISDDLQTAGRKERNQEKLAFMEAAIVLPEAETPLRWRCHCSKARRERFHFDSQSQSANRFVTQFSWAAPSGGGGGVGGPNQPNGREAFELPKLTADQG
jgi:hypothetical protein